MLEAKLGDDPPQVRFLECLFIAKFNKKHCSSTK